MIDDAGNDEQEIGQPIDVCEQMRLDMIRAERDNRSSARRHTVLEKCSSAPARLPPGRMKRRSGGSSASSRSIHSSSRRMSASVTATFVTRSAIFSAGSASRAPMANRSFCSCSISPRCPRELAFGADSAEAGVQLIDVAVGGHARVGLRHACPAEQRSAAGVAGTRVNLHGRQYT